MWHFSYNTWYFAVLKKKLDLFFEVIKIYLSVKLVNFMLCYPLVAILALYLLKMCCDCDAHYYKKYIFRIFCSKLYILYRYSSVSFKCGHCIQLKFKVPFCQISFLFEVPGSELFEFYTILLFQGICGQPEHFSNCEDWCGEDISKIRQDCRHIHAQGK